MSNNKTSKRSDGPTPPTGNSTIGRGTLSLNAGLLSRRITYGGTHKEPGKSMFEAVRCDELVQLGSRPGKRLLSPFVWWSTSQKFCKVGRAAEIHGTINIR